MEYSFSSMLEQMALEHGGRPAVTCGNAALNYSELLDASRRCADIFIAAGMKKGEKVILWAVNGIDWITEFFGIIFAGGIAVLMNYGMNEDGVTQLTEYVGANRAVIGANKISAAAPEKAVNAVVSGGVPKENIFLSAELMKKAADTSTPLDIEVCRKREMQVQPKDTQFIIFTTGTTSMPKAVQLSSFSVLNDAEIVMEHLKNDITSSICNALPLFHSYGLAMTMMWLCKGMHTYIVDAIKPQNVLDMVYKNKIGTIATLGAIYSGITALPDVEEKIKGVVKTCLVGGGFTTPTEMMRVENMLGGGKMLIGYGQTECSPVVSVNIGADPLEKRAVSVGRILPGIDVRIWVKDKGFVGAGEIGEVVVKGPITMNGYLNLPPEQQPFDEDGWLHTGDLGTIDENGLLSLSGRIKDIIIRSGENISPSEIEKKIMEHPNVKDAKVMGAPHPIWGESVEACIVPQTEPLDDNEMTVFLKKSLASYKIPSHYFMFSEFPLNTNGKLDARGLKVMLLEKLHKVFISNSLNEGLRIINTKVGNRNYTITPICDMVQGLVEQLSFSGRQVRRIRLAVEEMLTERIANAYDTNGEITFEIILMPQWLRINFTDSGKPYRLDDEQATMSARIILANVDAYAASVSDNGSFSSNLDWQYSDGFDINEYLMRNHEEGKA